MNAPQKQCPKCGTVAPLDATFCGQCGRQYRTQFTSPDAGMPPSAPAPFYSAPAPAAPRMPSVWILRAVQGLIAAIACFAVLSFSGVFRHDGKAPAPVTLSRSTTQQEPSAPANQETQVRRALSEDPIESEARRVIDRESKRLDLPPPVSDDGKVHLRSGGTISKEEWDAASRKAQQSPVNHDPTATMPPL